MNRNTFRKLLKITCIASVLIMMLCLCGCRARLTNNDEVLSAVYYDDEYMQYEYQMRRDELGLGKAKKPIFNGLGSAPEEEENFDEGDASRLEEYDPLADTPEPDEADPEPAKKKTTTARRGSSGSGGSDSGGGNSSKDPEKKPEEKPEEKPEKDPEPQLITVTLDPNGDEAVCDVDSITVEIGESYGKHEGLTDFPTANWEGHTFKGWYTTNGDKVTINTIVRTTKDHTLFAGWDESFTVTFDTNGKDATFTKGSQIINVKKGGSYGAIPDVACEGYEFKGWFSDKKGGSAIDPKAKVSSDQIWYAHWNGYDHWTAQLRATIDAINPEELKRILCAADDDIKAFVADWGGSPVADGERDFIVVFGDLSKADEEATKYPEDNFIMVSDIALSTAKEDRNIVLYTKLLLLKEVYGYDVTAAKSDLEIIDTDDSFIRVYNRENAQTPAGEGGADDGTAASANSGSGEETNTW